MDDIIMDKVITNLFKDQVKKETGWFGRVFLNLMNTVQTVDHLRCKAVMD